MYNDNDDCILPSPPQITERFTSKISGISRSSWRDQGASRGVRTSVMDKSVERGDGGVRDGFRDAASAFGVTSVTGRRVLLGKSAAATSEFLRRSAP